VIAPGQHYLNVSEDEFVFDFPGGTATLVAETDYAIDYRGFPAGIVVEESEITYSPAVTPGNEWLTLSPSSLSGTPSQSITLTVAPNTVPEERTAKVYVKAGNLTKVINVKQEEGLLYVGRFGGALTRNGNEWQFKNKLYIQGRDQGGANKTYQWSSNNDDTDVRDYWDGNGNTLKLYNRWKSTTNNYPAALACFTKNGTVTNETDPNYLWYLPAQRQLQAAWVSNYSFGTYKPSSANYWSATEFNAIASYAWRVAFGDGATGITTKPTSNPVRCVREVTTP
jgi:hypothetical protein